MSEVICLDILFRINMSVSLMSQMINELLAEKSTMDKDEGAGQGTYDHSVAQGNEGAQGIVEVAKQGFVLEQVNPVDQGTADKGGGI